MILHATNKQGTKLQLVTTGTNLEVQLPVLLWLELLDVVISLHTEAESGSLAWAVRYDAVVETSVLGLDGGKVM